MPLNRAEQRAASLCGDELCGDLPLLANTGESSIIGASKFSRSLLERHRVRHRDFETA